jgi:hypothetical protein
MNLPDELRKLAELHQEGHLTDQEFAEAKGRLIAESRAEPTAPPKEESAVSEAESQIADKRYQSSRWSSGNLFFPDSLTLASDGMLFRKGALFGSREEHINYRAVASFRIKNGIFLSDVCIETSGGSQPIFVNGLWKSEAKEIQETLRACQGRG